MGPAVVLFGPSGSGKSTIAKALAASHGATPLHFGDTLRELGRRGRLNESDVLAINSGEPISCSAILLAFEILTKPHVDRPAKLLVVDGPPRDLAQAHLLLKLFRIELIVHLNLADEALAYRLKQRFKALARLDDRKEYIHRKTAQFHEVELAIINAFKGISLLRLNADADPMIAVTEIVKSQPWNSMIAKLT
jgi:adenylate kinase family enzyme